MHTDYSDGTFSPEEVLKHAKEKNLSAVAICDHDTTEGAQEAAGYSAEYGVEVVPAVEVTSEREGIEIHILGYLIDSGNKRLAWLLGRLKESRIKRIYMMAEKLKEFDIDISPEDVFKLSGRGTVGRLHMAKVLCGAGHVRDIREAFNKYLGDNAPCYVRRFNASPEESIKIILESGGVPVYAHPKVMGRDDFIPLFMKAGLRGIEVYHTDHNKAATERYLALAAKLGLIATGGSDCHGLAKKNVLIGQVTMPYSTVEELHNEQRQILHEYRP